MGAGEEYATQNLLAAIPWDLLASQLVRTPSYKVAIASGALLTFGLLGRYLRALLAVGKGERPDFLAPVLRLVLFALVMANYHQLCRGVVEFVAALSQGMLGTHSVEGVWQARHDAYAAHWEAVEEGAREAISSRAGSINAGLELTAHLALSASQAAVVVVRAGQVFFLLVLFVAGPWMMALAFMGGPFSGLGFGWLAALLEVSSWSWALKMLAFSYEQVCTRMVQGPFTLSREIALCTALSLLTLLTPWLMARLFRAQALQQAARGMLQFVPPSGAQTRPQEMVRAPVGFSTNKLSSAHGMAGGNV